jgi:seryl-tRNA synthetase
MQAITMQLEREIHPDLVPELEKQSVYISQSLRTLKVSADRMQISLTFDSEEQADTCARVHRFLEAMIQGFRPVDQKIVARHERRNQRPYETDVFAKLIEKGWVFNLGHGQVALAGPAVRLANAIEQAVAKIGRDRFEATERMYPALIPSNVLAQCGYTSSFPQNLSVVTHLREDFDSIEKFRRANLDRPHLHIPEPGAFEEPKVCLCPALCYHSYPTLQNRRLGKEGHNETSIGRIARYESSSMAGLERLWEFTQRSIIWVGEDAFCSGRRELAIEAAMDLAKAWDIDCTVETANDPFFASVATAKSFWQRAQDLKFELRAAIEPAPDGTPRTLAAGSFNLHGPFFGRAFDISDASGEPAFSGCASWGVERLVIVIFTQHGLDFTQWPTALRGVVAA